MSNLNFQDKWVLSFDVSIPPGQITFLNCNDKSSLTETLDKDQKISRTLLPLVQKNIEKLKLNTENLCAIGFSTGPGSYMSLRIGISTAKGIALSLDCPILGFSSLEILVKDAIKNHLENSRLTTESLICIRGADKENIFFAKFELFREENKDGFYCKRNTDDKLIDFNKFAIEDEQNTIFIYSSINEEKISLLKMKHENILFLPINTSSLSVALSTLDKIKKGKLQENKNLLPTYCRDVKLG